MNPILRQAIIAVTLVGGGVYVGGEVVLAATDKDAIFQPIGLRHGVERVSLFMQYVDERTVLDGGRDDAGNFRDGGWTGLWTRTYSPNVRVEGEASLLPKVPFVGIEHIALGYTTSADAGGVEAVEAVIRATVVPAFAAAGAISMTDGGY